MELARSSLANASHRAQPGSATPPDDRHHDAVKPEEDVLKGAPDLDARVRELGFRRPLPDALKPHADRIRLHRRPDGSKMLMHVAGEFAHVDDLSPGGVRLPTTRVASDDLRVLVLGDSGSGDEDQHRVAGAMKRFMADDHHGTHFVLHAGDAVYPNGVRAPQDDRLRKTITEPYEDLGKPMYLALGNHEYGDSRGSGDPDAIVTWANSDAPEHVEMPARYYAFAYEFGGGRADFFVLDATVLASDPDQQQWLKRELAASTADYKIVVGHQPIGSHGQHLDSPHLDEVLLPVLTEHADLYVSGHEHDQQLLVLDGGVPQLVSGTGHEGRTTGRGTRTVGSVGEAAGYAALDFSGDSLQVSFIDAATNRASFQTSLAPRARRKSPTGPVDRAADIRAAFGERYKVVVGDQEIGAGLSALFAHHHEAGYFKDRLDGIRLEPRETSEGPLEFLLVPNRKYDAKQGGLEEKGECSCPFCLTDEPVTRVLQWRGWRVQPNRYPYAPAESRHVVLAKDGHVDQQFQPQILADMIDYQRLAPTATTMHYNGIAGNSQQHLHWHASDETMPIERLLDDDTVDHVVRRASRDGQVATYNEGFYAGIHVEGTKDYVVRWASRIVEALDADPAVRGHYNLLLLKPRPDGRARLVVVPRRAEAIKREIEGLGTMNFGAWGVVGRAVVIKPELPEEAVESYVREAAHTVVRADEIAGLEAVFTAPEMDALALRLLHSSNQQVEIAKWNEHDVHDDTEARVPDAPEALPRKLSMRDWLRSLQQ